MKELATHLFCGGKVMSPNKDDIKKAGPFLSIGAKIVDINVISTIERVVLMTYKDRYFKIKWEFSDGESFELLTVSGEWVNFIDLLYPLDKSRYFEDDYLMDRFFYIREQIDDVDLSVWGAGKLDYIISNLSEFRC